MRLLCPECQRKTLKITRRLELPPDHRSDEVALQIIGCASCGFRGIAVYEESRRGALDSESWSHWGYPATASALRSLDRKLKQCPDPHNPRCDCAVHREFARAGAGSHWSEMLPGVDWGNPFGIGSS